MESLRNTEVWRELEEFFGGKIYSLSHVGVNVGRPATVAYEIDLFGETVGFTSGNGGFFSSTGNGGLEFVAPLLFKDVIYINPAEFNYWSLKWHAD